MGAARGTPFLLRAVYLSGLVAFAALAYGQAAGQGAEKGKAMLVTSKDGTRIAYDKVGKGPAVVVVSGALSTRSGGAELAQLLASNFTVYNYDRRGRGDSGDGKPYSVQREVEDLEAVIDAAGGTAHVYGKSSGAALALQAASSLGSKVRKLALYEAPYSEAEGAANEWRAFRSRIDELLAAGRKAAAVTQFMKFVGAPDEAITKMKASPAWPAMETMAPTLAYDNAVLGDDRSVPVATAAKIRAVTLVMDGSASQAPMPFMRLTADKLAKVIPNAKRLTVEGQAHDVSAKALAPILLKFFSEPT